MCQKYILLIITAQLYHPQRSGVVRTSQWWWRPASNLGILWFGVAFVLHFFSCEISMSFQCRTIMRRPPWVHAYIRMSCLSRWGRLFSRMAMVMSMGGWWCRRVNIVLHFTGTCWLSVALIHIRTDDIGQLRLTLSTVSLPRVVVLVPQWQFLRG